MIPDITLPSGVWNNVYTATGIAAGTPIMIQNKSGNMVFLWEGPVAPASSSWDGVTFCNEPWVADQIGVSGCWIRSNATVIINVQAFTL